MKFRAIVLHTGLAGNWRELQRNGLIAAVEQRNMHSRRCRTALIEPQNLRLPAIACLQIKLHRNIREISGPNLRFDRDRLIQIRTLRAGDFIQHQIARHTRAQNRKNR